MNAGGQASSGGAGLISYLAPAITSIDPRSAPTQGGQLITVRGLNFGISGSLRLDGTLFQQPWVIEFNSSQFERYNHTTIVARIPEG